MTAENKKQSQSSADKLYILGLMQQETKLNMEASAFGAGGLLLLMYLGYELQRSEIPWLYTALPLQLQKIVQEHSTVAEISLIILGSVVTGLLYHAHQTRYNKAKRIRTRRQNLQQKDS